ncbi:polyglutamine-binding 1-like [Paramuricea clavata]|uniref:Polyglutamine-binding protein 1 n=1 Tax=Paramuricea clavata TaxID=317549 RepID=A0A6S7HZC3_PARCT|nr:polyglutamine-binding 1-like [Paramuricea clavata]
MPLPAALQARLAKRGLIKTDEPEKENTDANQVSSGKCPNTSNPYHECSEYCRKRWGSPAETNTNEAHYQQMMLPPGWFLVPDNTSGASYYWNTMTNQVSWLHPLNPKAQITNPVMSDGRGHEVMPNTAIPSPLVGSDEREQVLNIGKHPSLVKGSQKKMQAAVKRKQQEQEARARKKKMDDLDPLDPAAYSDVPRGTWSTGLVDKGDAKTGVDTTANGPLFQQRPYPSPGEVLRRNAAIKS